MSTSEKDDLSGTPDPGSSESLKPRIIVADDDDELRSIIVKLLETAGWDVLEAENGQVALDLARERTPQAVLLDLAMPVRGGQETLEELLSLYPDLPVVILTGQGDIERAVEAMKKGAFDFLTKPPDAEHLLLVLERSIENRRRDLELAESRRRDHSRFTLIGGKSPAMKTYLEQLGRAAASDSTVMLIGETGSGKELAARTIWSQGRRADAPFIAVNCGLLPDEHIELTLFGTEPDPGGDSQKGRVEEADGGTLFLDKVGELPTGVQSQLVNVLEEGEYRRVGGGMARSTNLRLIAANSSDLKEWVVQGFFREDLYHHLSVVVLEVPALRDCREDMHDMVDHYLHQLCAEMGKPIPTLGEGVWERLESYTWPGNSRELRNTLERALVLSGEGTNGRSYYQERGRSRPKFYLINSSLAGSASPDQRRSNQGSGKFTIVRYI